MYNQIKKKNGDAILPKNKLENKNPCAGQGFLRNK